MGKWLIIGLVALATIGILFIVLASMYPGFREISRDIAVIILALFQLISSIVLVALLIVALYAVRLIRDTAQTSVLPRVDALTAKLDQVIENTSAITGDAKTTAASVSSTTSYVTEQLVGPIVRVSGLFAGIRAAASYLVRRNPPGVD